jgi:hypothetical protein
MVPISSRKMVPSLAISNFLKETEEKAGDEDDETKKPDEDHEDEDNEELDKSTE